MGKHIDASQPEYRRNPQGNLVLCTWVYLVQRPTTSWISWQELKQVDWNEKAAWTKGMATRKELLENWEDVFRVMEILTGHYGDEGVRLIAWQH